MINDISTNFFLFVGSGSSGGYNRGHHSNDDDNRGGSGGGGYNRARNDHHSNDSGGGGGGDSGLETQHDTIFIQNLPRSVTPAELKDLFSQIGVIKVRYGILSFNSL
jgi:hypothetical protein